MKRLYTYWTRLNCLTILLFFSLHLAGPKRINGLITGTEGMPLAGATIEVQGTNMATASATDGSFSITAKEGDVLLISSVGREKTAVKVTDQTFITITLLLNIKSLEEVFLVGYGTSRKKDITGAVAKLTAKAFNRGIVSDPLQQVQGKIAGLVINKPGGDPNGEFTVRLRGATSLEGQPPLVVIDGVAIDDFYKAIATLNPNDVEAYDVLKDASAAAIYGARGANGVILITTKSSKSGWPSVEYNGWTGIESVSNQLKVLTAEQWREATAAIGGGGLDKGANTNWQKAISRTAYSHNHSIALHGGNMDFNYRGSINYLRQEGVILNSGKEFFSGRLTVNQKSVNNKLDVRYAVNTSITTRDLLFDQSSVSQSRLGGSFAFDLTLGYLPVWPAYHPDGSYHNIATKNFFNPLFLLKEIYRKQRENFFQTSVKTDYELLKGLKAGVLGAITRTTDVHDFFYPGIRERNDRAFAEKNSYNKQNFTGDIHLHYRRTFQKHTVDITGVYEYNKFVNDGFGVMARGFLVPQLLNNNLGAATDVQPGDLSSYKQEVKLISFLSRLVYNYDDRYIFTANFRRDGSSKFGINNRWGNFPSFALAWRVSNERFLKSPAWLNDLKLRVSYGFTGNQENLPPYPFQLLYGPAGPYLYNGRFLQSYAVVQEPNPDLKWEVRKSINTGIDFSLFNDRLSGTVDVFHERTSDMLFLYDLPQPPFLTNKVFANAANAVNKGVEISLRMTLVRSNHFQWITDVNVGTLTNRITSLSGQFKGTTLSITNRHYGYADGAGLSGAYVSELKPGYPAGVFWVPQHAGLDAAGRELYNNYDANGKFTGTSLRYTDRDRVFIDPTPDFTWGYTNQITYRDFDFQFLLRGVQGQKIFANSLMNLGAAVFLPGTNVGPHALTYRFTNQPQPSTYWIRNGSYARLDNVTIGYQFRNSKGINVFRIYFTATNLFVFTHYEGIDTEIKTEGSQRYIDMNYYPKARGFIVGLNMKFY